MTFLYQKKKKTQNNGKPGGEPVGGNKEQPSRIHIILLLAVTRWYRLASPALSSSIPPSSPTSPLLIPAFISLHSPTFHSMEIRGSHKPAWSRGKVKRTERTRQRRQRQTGKRIFIYVCETAANAGEKTTTWDLFFPTELRLNTANYTATIPRVVLRTLWLLPNMTARQSMLI